MTQYLTVAETAKIIRKALKEAFPDTKFSVRSHKYSMGASIMVGWTDGASVAAVETITKTFESATFDSMTDYKGGKVHKFNGEEVSFGADYIHTSRDATTHFVEAANLAFNALSKDEQTELYNKASEWAKDNGKIRNRALVELMTDTKPQHSPTAASVELVRTY